MATTWTAAQFAAHKVLTEHRPGLRIGEGTSMPLCSCGADLDGSHADHLVNVMTEAGVFGGPVQHGTVEQLIRDADDGR